MKPPPKNINIYLLLLLFCCCFEFLTAQNGGGDKVVTILSSSGTSPGFETDDIANEAAINNVYYACGNGDGDEDNDDEDGDKDGKCTCSNATLNCKPIYYWKRSRKFNHTNIRVADNKFIVKNVIFERFSLDTLQKDQLLPGHENTTETLSIKSSSIQNIENGTFDGFTNLKTLDLSRNSLKNIHEGIFTKELGSTLLELNLAYNQLDSISFDFMTNLIKLDLTSNFMYLKKLYKEVNGKNITIFSPALSNLQILILNQNYIRNIEDDAFENLVNLKEFHMYWNYLATIPKAIRSLKNLEHLNLAYGNLVNVGNCSFCNLTKLKKVFLTDNYYLSYIDENAFGAISNGFAPPIEEFFAENCNIKILSEKLLNWKTVNHIGIQRNLFTCNCSMAWLINDMKAENPLHIYKLKDSANRSIKYSLKCSSPSALNGVKFNNLAGQFCKNDTEDHEAEDDSHVTYVCGLGSNFEDACSCDGQKLKCKYKPKRDYWHYWGYDHDYYNRFKNISHIEIIDNKEAIKVASFIEFNIKVLNKGEIMRGNEKYFEKITIFESKIEEIGDGTFDAFTSLKSLTLSKNKIKNITNRVLTKKLGSTLMELDLSGNLFTQLQPDAFQYLTKLENLSLSNNPNLNFSMPLFSSGLAALEKLDLSDCKIYNLTQNIFANLTNLKTLILNGNPFTAMPKVIHYLPQLLHFHISDSTIAKFNRSDFEFHNKLETFTAISGSLQSIEDCAFCDFPNLKKIFFEKNRNLSFIHENAFGSIDAGIPKTLEAFSIENCGLKVLPEKLLNWNILNLKHLSPNPFTCNCSNAWLINDLKAMTSKYPNIFDKLDLQCFDEFSAKFKYFNNVPECITEDEEIIYVCGEDTSLSKGCKCENNALECHYAFNQIFSSTNIKILDENFIVKNASFSYNNIKFLKKDNILPSREHEIEELDFSFNKIEDIENETFDNFSSLKTLILKNNALTKIDEGILTFELGETLEKLDLSQNHLTNITNSTFVNLHNLTSLSLAFNEKINFSSSEIMFSENLSNLKVLDLGGCNISDLHEHIFVNLISLETLGLYHNPITSLPKALQVLSSLRHFDIHDSKLASLNNYDLLSHPELEILDVSASNIFEIGDCTFCNLTKLKKVFLNQNHRLYFIHENAFGSNDSEIIPNLEIFSIEKCNVSFLPENLLDWKTLKHLHVGENPFICDCSMAWIIRDLNSFQSVLAPKSLDTFENKNELICFNPPQFRGINFNNVSEEFCLNNTHPIISPLSITEVYKTKNESDSIVNWWSLIIFLCIIVAAIIAFGIYFYRNRQAKNLQNQGVGISNENFQEDEENKIEEDFDDTNNPTTTNATSEASANQKEEERDSFFDWWFLGIIIFFFIVIFAINAIGIYVYHQRRRGVGTQNSGGISNINFDEETINDKIDEEDFDPTENA